MWTTDEHARLEHDRRTRQLRRLAVSRRAPAPPPRAGRQDDWAQAEQAARRISAELPDVDVRVVIHDGELACLVRSTEARGHV